MMSLTYEYRFCDDIECKTFIENNFPADVFDAFESLQIGAAKADLWRILVLQKYGGVYIDIDAAFCWPLERMITDDQTELFVQLKDGSITNHFIAVCPNHPLIREIADRIVSNIKENTLKSVFDMTGPTVVTEVLQGKTATIGANRYVARQALITTKKHQYPEKLAGYWVEEQKKRSIVRSDPPS
jgi:mannosyltransferase OCH1-like enzyme